MIARLVSDKCRAVRVAAAAGRRHLSAFEALDVLIDAPKDKSADVRSWLAFAFARMTRQTRAREALQILKTLKMLKFAFGPAIDWRFRGELRTGIG